MQKSSRHWGWNALKMNNHTLKFRYMRPHFLCCKCDSNKAMHNFLVFSQRGSKEKYIKRKMHRKCIKIKQALTCFIGQMFEKAGHRPFSSSGKKKKKSYATWSQCAIAVHTVQYPELWWNKEKLCEVKTICSFINYTKMRWKYKRMKCDSVKKRRSNLVMRLSNFVMQRHPNAFNAMSIYILVPKFI